jgi:hypothetical protein
MSMHRTISRNIGRSIPQVYRNLAFAKACGDKEGVATLRRTIKLMTKHSIRWVKGIGRVKAPHIPKRSAVKELHREQTRKVGIFTKLIKGLRGFMGRGH